MPKSTNQPPPITRHDDDDDVSRAEQQVALRKADLKRSLHVAGRSSEQLAARLGMELKPALIAVAAVAGAAVLAGIGVALMRRRPRSWLPPQEPSALGRAARGLGLLLARTAARRLAEEVARRIATPAPLPASVASPPNQI